MIFKFGKLKVQVDYVAGVRERQESMVGHTEYRATLKAPGLPNFVRTTWKSQLFTETEEQRIRNVAIDFMYTLVDAWAYPGTFLASEFKAADENAETRDDLEERKEMARETVRYAAELDPFMPGAIDDLWALTRRDDEKWQRGPREWLPRRRS